MRSVGALYLHVPFCARKCAYCDFASKATPRNDDVMDEHVCTLVATINRAMGEGLLETCKTAYIGGGTPTYLGTRRLSTLVEAIRDACPQLEELSFEANPDSLSTDVLAGCRDAGATRVSIGVQSLVDRELRSLGRLHDAARAHGVVNAAVASGLDVSVDLMCAIEHQTDTSWERSLNGVIALGVGHVSVYPLTLEEGTPLWQRHAHKPPAWNDEDVQAHRMEMAQEVLESRGFKRYEVASYAKPSKECRHNIAYWTGVTYLGLGSGASSMLDREQYDAIQSHSWLGHLPVCTNDAARVRISTPGPEVEFLNKREAWAEDLMLGMRLVRGVDSSLVPQHTVDDLRRRGLVRCDDGRLVPTHDGWLLGNELFGELWNLAT